MSQHLQLENSMRIHTYEGKVKAKHEEGGGVKVIKLRT